MGHGIWECVNTTFDPKTSLYRQLSRAEGLEQNSLDVRDTAAAVAAECKPRRNRALRCEQQQCGRLDLLRQAVQAEDLKR